MKKFAKMSLVAAVAVAGLSSTVSAQPLEEAIKGVDVSGMMRYRYDDTKVDNVGSAQNNNYRLDVNTKSKVNDIVTANVTVGLSNDGKGVNLGGANGTGVASNDNAAAETGATLYVRNANFAANISGVTVIAGKQSIPGPFVDNTVDDVTRGTGAVVLAPVGPVTLAAGHFTNTSAAAAVNATELAVMADIAGVKADLWYANVDTTPNAIKAYSLHANGTFAGVNVDARYTSKDNNVANSDDATLTKIVASGKVSDITLTLGYAATGKNNAAGNNVSIDGDNDAQVDAKIWQASMGALADATAVFAGISAPVMNNVTASLTYIDVSCDAVNDASEALAQVTYNMSKNFSVHARYSMYEANNVDTNKGRLELKYTF